MQALAIEPNYPLFASAETIACPPAWCAVASCLLRDDEQIVGLAERIAARNLLPVAAGDVGL